MGLFSGDPLDASDLARIREPVQRRLVRWKRYARATEAVLHECLADVGHPNFTDRHGLADCIRAVLAKAPKIKKKPEAPR